MTVELAFAAALRLHQAGRLGEAEAIYRQILAVDPRHAGALHFLGVIALQAGHYDVAVELIGQAIALAPGVAEFYPNFGAALGANGRMDEAIAACRQAIALAPNLPNAHYHLGRALYATRARDGAIAAYGQAIALDPDFSEAHRNLAAALMDTGRREEAIAAYRRVIAGLPNHAETHSNLGVALLQQGQVEEAIAACRQAVALKPDLAAAHYNLGNALHEKHALEEAIAAYRRAIALNPDLHLAHINLGNSLKDDGRMEEALAAYRQAIAHKPNFPEAHSNLGGVLKDQGQMTEAIAAHRQAVLLDPNLTEAHSNLIYALDLLEGASFAEQQAERRRWDEQHARKWAEQIQPHENVPEPERRLRVGYVSADFRRHSAYYVFAPVICGHDAEGFEVFCYSGVTREDDATARLRHAAHAWRSTVGVSDDALAEQIRRDRIDILVDLSGHSAGHRLLVFARKPAPVQVTAWGHATGTGLKAMDYFFADARVLPAAQRAHFAEEVIDLSCVLCYEPPEYLPAVSALPTAQGHPLTYGCVNRLEKITDRTIALWGRTIAGAPGARLLVKEPSFTHAGRREQFLERLHRVGRIDAERMMLVGASPHAEHLKIFHQIDIGLDPFPMGGGVSTAEALWMGVPLVTLEGATVPGRITASLLSQVGMEDWVAQTDDDYVAIALRAGRELERVADLRANLRERLKASPCGDAPRYTRAVEQAYRQMWRQWCDAHGGAG